MKFNSFLKLKHMAWASGALVAAVLVNVVARSGAKASVQPPSAPVVQVAAVEERDVPVYGEWVGTLTGQVNADVKAQVTGYLLKRDYKEGSVVHKGEPLFEIDPRPFRTALDQANGQLEQSQAQLIQDEAQLATAEANQLKSQLNVEKYEPLAKVDAVTEEARLTPRDIDLVLLIGGSSRIPLVQREMQERFGSRITHVKNADTIIAEGAALVDYMGMHPVLARSIGVRLSNGAFYELFPAGTMAKPGICEKTINFFCTDNRDGEAKLVLVEKYEGREMNERILGIPVSAELPRKYNHCERVSVTLSLDEDLVLRVFGKGATQERHASAEYHDLLFALDISGVRS